MEEKKSYKEKIQEDVFIRSVKIKFPLKLFKRFDAFARLESNHCYWLAIEKLMDKYESNEEIKKKIDLLFLKVEEIENRLFELEEQPEKETKEVKTFGKK